MANAVFEQADVIMLSGETTVGRYPVECVKIFDRVARRIERSGGAGYGVDIFGEKNDKKAVAAVVCDQYKRPKARGLYPPWNDGPICFEYKAREYAPLFVYINKRGPLLTRSLLVRDLSFLASRTVQTKFRVYAVKKLSRGLVYTATEE